MRGGWGRARFAWRLYTVGSDAHVFLTRSSQLLSGPRVPSACAQLVIWTKEQSAGRQSQWSWPSRVQVTGRSSAEGVCVSVRTMRAHLVWGRWWWGDWGSQRHPSITPSGSVAAFSREKTHRTRSSQKSAPVQWVFPALGRVCTDGGAVGAGRPTLRPRVCVCVCGGGSRPGL